MTKEEALELIQQALIKAVPTADLRDIQPQTHLVKEGIIDSLDTMVFVYELEALCGVRLAAIDKDFTDFRVQRLIEIVHGR